MIAFHLFLFVQIIVESLPISSSGHIRILQYFYPLNVSNAVFEYIEFLAHGPTIVVLAIFFFSSWFVLVQKLFFQSTTKASRRRLLYLLTQIFIFVFVVDSITAGFYVFLRIFLKDAWWWNSNVLLLIGFFITAFLLYISQWASNKQSGGRLSVFSAVCLGAIQGLALLPGISRFASTYVGARFLYFSRRRSFELSFLIQSPLLFAAFIKGLWAIVGHKALFSTWQTWIVIVGATCLAYVALLGSWYCARTDRLWPFSFYLLVPMAIQLYIIVSSF